jgi:hypothetical protein
MRYANPDAASAMSSAAMLTLAATPPYHTPIALRETAMARLDDFNDILQRDAKRVVVHDRMKAQHFLDGTTQ